MSITDITRLPLATVAAAYGRLVPGGTAVGKAAQAQVLHDLARSGKISLGDITNSRRIPAPLAAAPAPAVSPAALAGAMTQFNGLAADIQGVAVAVQTVTAQVKTLREDTANSLSGIGRNVAGLEAGLKAHGAQLSVLTQDLGSLRSQVSQIKIDPAEAAAAIRAAVLAEWAPFRQAVEAAGTQAEAVAVAEAGPVGRASALDLFGLDLLDAKGQPLMFDTYAHPEAPAVDPCFIWTEAIVRHLYIAQAHGRNLWMGGPAGTGKTQTAQQFAARTGRMFRRFVFDRFATRDDFLGATGIVDGDTDFAMGPVLEVYTTHGAICLLDEVGMGQPAAMSALNAFLERAAQVAYAGKVWHRAPGSMFVAADNSLTQGDTSGRFSGVNGMNTAFSERFSLVVPFAYLDADTEVEALRRHTLCSDRLARHVVSILAILRSKVDTGDIIDPPSIRQAVAFVEALSVLTPAEAWRSAIAARQPAESEVALAAVFASSVDQTLISEEI